MKERKFRAWDNTNKFFWPQDEFQVRFNGIGGRPTLILSWGELGNTFTVQEYTSFKDSHGVEIYEGDFVEDQQGIIGEVIWWCGTWMRTTRYSGGESTFPWPMYKEPVLKVVGNIFEDEDMLKNEYKPYKSQISVLSQK